MALASTSSAQTYLFNRAGFPAVTDPADIATGDFNNDGKLDLVIVNNRLPGNIAILFGKPDGTFEPPVEYPVGGWPGAVAVADFNGDGNLDIAVTNSNDNTVSILLGNGDGTFQGRSDFPTGVNPRGVTVGDFNGDGQLDLAVVNAIDFLSPGSVSVLLGNGDGTFQSHVDYSTGRAPGDVITVDLDGDGSLDLAVTNIYGNSVSILLGNGDGTFRTHAEAATAGQPVSLAAEDFNGDGKPDLAVACQSTGDLSILIGNGDGTFQPHVDYRVGYSPNQVVTGDFNSDGKLDLVLVQVGIYPSSQNVSVLLGNGDGTFQTHIDYSSSGTPRALAIGDFNGDGELDLAIANFNGNNPSTVTILLGFGNGSFSPRTDYPTGIHPVAGTTGDFDGDGNRDLAIASDAKLSILLGNGDGTFQPHVDYAGGSAPMSLASGDFNGDGRLDIAVANWGGGNPGSFSIFLGNGDGTFRPRVDYPLDRRGIALATGDFNRDGKLDLAVVRDGAFPLPSSVSILLGNGDGTFQPPTHYELGPAPRAITVADFNGDGKLDLAVTDDSGLFVSILLGNGDGTFQSRTDYPAGPSPNAIAAADFNSDDIPDLAVVNFNTGSSGLVSIFLGNGDGTFQPRVSYATGIFTTGVAVGDFNGDGKMDVAAANTAGDTVSVLIGNGDGTLRPHTDYSTGRVPLAVLADDFNGDGSVDLAVVNSQSDTVSVLLNTPVIALYPTTLKFADQFVGTPSMPLSVRLANPGSTAVAVLSIDASGDFAQTNDCGSTVAVGASCTINVTFTPSDTGPRSGAITIMDHSLGNPQLILLAGTGIPLVASARSPYSDPAER